MYQHGDRMDDVLSTDDLDYIDIDKLSSMDEFLRATESLEGKDKWTTCRVKSEDIDRVYLALAYKLWNENVANVKMALEIVLRDDGQKAKQERLLKSSKMNRKNTQENSTLFWGNHPEWIFQYNNGNFGFIFTGDNYFSLEVDMKEGQRLFSRRVRRKRPTVQRLRLLHPPPWGRSLWNEAWAQHLGARIPVRVQYGNQFGLPPDGRDR